MQIFRKKSMLAAGIGAVLLFVFAVIFICVGDHGASAPRAVFAGIFFVLMTDLAFMVAALHESFRITLYAYKNIGLVGGIIFVTVLAVTMLAGYFKCKYTAGFELGRMYTILQQFPRNFSLGALFVIIAISILVGVSNISLIRHEGLSRNNVLSIVLAGFYIAATVLIYLANDLMMKYVFGSWDIASPFFKIAGIALPMFLMMLLCYLECVFVGAIIMGWLVVRKKPAYDKDFIIILGCSIDKKGGLLPLLKGRVNSAIRFAWQQEIETGKPARYVPSGGQGPNEIMSEGSAMELYLKTRGAEDDEVFPERKSVNTLENLCFSKKIIDELDPDATIAFATTNYHILRSGILARMAGFDAEGIAGDTKWYFWPNGFVREFFGILSIKKKAHISVAAVLFVISVIVGIVGYIGF